MSMANNQTLLQGARRFEMGALADIYDTFSPAIYRYAMRLLGDNDQAEECVAETFSRFLVALKHGKGPREHLQAYLYRVAHNWITDVYRRKLPPLLPLDPEMHADVENDPPQVFSQELEQQMVRDALALLTSDQRQVIVLKYIEDMNNSEIADTIEKPIGAVKALQHRGIQALRRILFLEEGDLL